MLYFIGLAPLNEAPSITRDVRAGFDIDARRWQSRHALEISKLMRRTAFGAPRPWFVLDLGPVLEGKNEAHTWCPSVYARVNIEPMPVRKAGIDVSSP
jgi:hypothetical protein